MDKKYLKHAVNRLAQNYPLNNQRLVGLRSRRELGNPSQYCCQATLGLPNQTRQPRFRGQAGIGRRQRLHSHRRRGRPEALRLPIPPSTGAETDPKGALHLTPRHSTDSHATRRERGEAPSSGNYGTGHDQVRLIETRLTGCPNRASDGAT